MYSEQSLVELDAIPCKECSRSFTPKNYVKHFEDGRPKCSLKKRPVFNSAKARIENNDSLNNNEKKQALEANKRVTSELAIRAGKREKRSTVVKCKDKDRKWRVDSRKLRDIIRAYRVKRRIHKAGKRGEPARLNSKIL